MYAEIDTDDNKRISLQEFLEYYCEHDEVYAQNHLNKSKGLRISDKIRDLKPNAHSLSTQEELAGPNDTALEQMNKDVERLKAQHDAFPQECKTPEQPQVSHTAGAVERAGAVAAPPTQLLAPFGGGSVQRGTHYSGMSDSEEDGLKRTEGTAATSPQPVRGTAAASPQPVRGSWRDFKPLEKKSLSNRENSLDFSKEGQQGATWCVCAREVFIGTRVSDCTVLCQI